MWMYLGVLALSLVSCAVGFAVDIAQGNLVHLAQGRKPNAGAALFPDIPFIPLFYVAAWWLANRFAPDAGPALVLGYGVASILLQLVSLARARARLRRFYSEAPR